MCDKKALNLERLKEYLKKIGSTNQEIADVLNCDVSTITKIFNGNRQPSFDLLKKICLAANSSMDYLFELSDVASTDVKLKTICNYTGLSEQAILTLNRLSKGKIITNSNNEDSKKMEKIFSQGIEFIDFVLSNQKTDEDIKNDILDGGIGLSFIEELAYNIFIYRFAVETQRITLATKELCLTNRLEIELNDKLSAKSVKNDVVLYRYEIMRILENLLDRFIKQSNDIFFDDIEDFYSPLLKGDNNADNTEA